MRVLRSLPLLIGMFVVSSFHVGCEDDDGPVLSSSHEGFGNPGCWANDCHTEDDTHNSDMQPYECVECHGNNGSPSKPSDHGAPASCGQLDECHPDQHGNNGFPDPESCNTCH